MKLDVFSKTLVGGNDSPSLLTFNEIIKITQEQNIFKKSVEERAKKVGNVRYIGWKENFYNRNGKLILYIDLYFLVKGEKHKNYRNDYLIIIEMPYYKNIKNFKRIYSKAPLKIFCSDPSFIFFGDAYILKNYYNALLLPENRPDIFKFVKKAINKPPIIRNPKNIPYLTKHSFKLLLKWLYNEKPSRILKDQYKLRTHIRIPEWRQK